MIPPLTNSENQKQSNNPLNLNNAIPCNYTIEMNEFSRRTMVQVENILEFST